MIHLHSFQSADQPGHVAPAVLSQAYLEGTYSEIYPDKNEDVAGMQQFFKQFPFPGGIGSHATPETPGSIHEGGELGYSLSHVYGTVYDNPDLITLVMVGDGEAETGPLATSWHSNKFLNPITDGAVLPVLHLNGYKINNPTILARISRRSRFGCSLATGTRRISSRGAIRSVCIRRWRRPWSIASWRSVKSAPYRPSIPAALAHRHSTQSQRLDGPAQGGGALSRGLLAGADR